MSDREAEEGSTPAAGDGRRYTQNLDIWFGFENTMFNKYLQ
jgi:hypothetical protein